MPARGAGRRPAGGRAGGSVAAHEIDWISLQAAVIRETGWTIAAFRQQPVGDVFDLWDDLRHNPPAHQILAWLHMKPKASRSRAAAQAEVKKEDLGDLAKTFGMAAQPMPQHIREQHLWAQAEIAKLKKPKKKAVVS